MLAVVRWWRAEQLKRLRSVELPEHDQMREAFDVRKAELKVGRNGYDTLGIVSGAKSLGNVAAFLEGTAYKSNGPRRKHMRRNLHQSCDFEASQAPCLPIGFDV